MAINWLLALKAVPWSDVVQAAPHIVKGARKLFTSVRGQVAGTPVDAGSGAGTGEYRGGVVPRLAAVEAAVEALDAEQRASAELIRSLAEQNAKVIEAIEILRARMRLALVACGLLALALGALALWMLAR